MNGVHDMGGMHGLEPIAPEADEPIFHDRWEARVLALVLAVGAWRRWTLDASRHARELIPHVDYLRMSYYEKWLAALIALMQQTKLLTAEEIASGRAAKGTAKAAPPLTADHVTSTLSRGGPTERSIECEPRYRVGQSVRARNMHPTGHTRLPRYARDKQGVVTHHHGAHVFPDTNAHGLGEQPQHLYQVRFEARDLWGRDDRSAVYIDLWESYLERI